MKTVVLAVCPLLLAFESAIFLMEYHPITAAFLMLLSLLLQLAGYPIAEKEEAEYLK